jgi:hypothetical protein
MDRNGAGVFVEEERSANPEVQHTNEVVGYMSLWENAFEAEAPVEAVVAVPEEPVAQIEMGRITNLNHQMQTVTLSKTFHNPVVIAGALSYNGGDPSTVRVTNVQSNSFEIQLQEWEYLDGPHTTETVSWMVVEAGCVNPKQDGGYCAGVIPQVGEGW